MKKHEEILVFFHCASNPGYAIGRLETIFLEMAQRLTEDNDRIHFGYANLNGGFPAFLPNNFKNVILFDTQDSNTNRLREIHNYIRHNNIAIAFGFDQPVSRSPYRIMRRAGVRLFISYWGAPISTINHGFRLLLKRVEVWLRRSKPDHFIFESRAMAEMAIRGRGISKHHVSVVHTGVDTQKFKPNLQDEEYAHEVFQIPRNRRIIFYSGHMEERKGVSVIIQSANELIKERKRTDVHFLLLGNRKGQEKNFAPMYSGTETEKYITFGGYRDDINRILRSSYAGVIASTGWDSFPMSSLEIASTGLPLVASDLHGIAEGMENGKTGYLIQHGDHIGLADRLQQLLNSQALQRRMGQAAREWAVQNFSREKQIESLTATVRRLSIQHS